MYSNMYVQLYGCIQYICNMHPYMYDGVCTHYVCTCVLYICAHYMWVCAYMCMCQHVYSIFRYVGFIYVGRCVYVHVREHVMCIVYIKPTHANIYIYIYVYG